AHLAATWQAPPDPIFLDVAPGLTDLIRLKLGDGEHLGEAEPPHRCLDVVQVLRRGGDETAGFLQLFDVEHRVDEVSTPTGDLPHDDAVGLAPSDTIDAVLNLPLGHLPTGLVEVGDRLSDDREPFTLSPLAAHIFLYVIGDEALLTIPDLGDANVDQHTVSARPLLLTRARAPSCHLRPLADRTQHLEP